MAPLRVEASAPWGSFLFKLIFETTDKKWERYYDECRAAYESSTIAELEEILRKSEETILQELVTYAAAYERSVKKAAQATCGTPGRLAYYNRELRHSRLRVKGKGRHEWMKTREELLNNREILEQILEQSTEQSEEEHEDENPRQQTLAKQIEEITSRLEEVGSKLSWCSHMDEDLLPRIRDEHMHPIISENDQQSVRIPFFGSDRQAFRRGENAIVSFPGVHGQSWEKLTEVSREANSPFATSCIFLPDEKAPGYGQHDPKADGSCCCVDLYGKQERWACHWFTKWKEQTLRASSRGCNLLVVTKMDGSLGRSQQGEVTWLDEEDLPYKRVSIKDFAEMIFSPPAK
eukprot:Skav234579  [mRNA]  locus=scaffold313:25593:26636:- [translate_table: standard]